MEKVIVDKDLCIGCGMCVQNNPEYFAFDDEGHAEAIDVELKNEDKNEILDRVDECPGQAIKVEQVTSDVKEDSCNCPDNCECRNEEGDCTCGDECECGCEESNCTISIDKDSCIGCGMCAGDNPDYFTLGSDGYATTTTNVVKKEDIDSVESTANNCPGGAIKVEE